MASEFLKAADVARTLKISKSLAYRLMAEGHIPTFRVGRVVRVSIGDLETFLRAHTHSADGLSGRDTQQQTEGVQR
jgi:excisionase family DNA binding protein